MAAKGWISLHRKIQECFLWGNDEPFDRRSAWIDLLLLANHKDAKTMFDGNPIVVKEGQRITSIRFLAQRWGWSTKKTTNFLKVLESENMIVKQSDRKKTLLTIVNYSIYQDVGNSEETQKKHSGDTEETLRKHRLPTNNNDNNDNNENNENNDNNNNPPNPPSGGNGRKKDQKKLCNRELMESFFQSNPNVVFSDGVMDALYEWCEYKEQKKKRYAAIGMKNLLNDVFEAKKKYGEYSVEKSIRRCMASNYAGIFYSQYEDTESRKMNAADLIKQFEEEEENEKKRDN